MLCLIAYDNNATYVVKKSGEPSRKLGFKKAVNPAIKLGFKKAVNPAIKLGVKKAIRDSTLIFCFIRDSKQVVNGVC